MKQKIFIMLFACLSASFAGKAQVTIGTLQDPHRAALLHLRTTTQDVPVAARDTLGTKLPVVALPDTAHLNLGDALIYNLDVDETATGMVVYNITDDPCGRGLIPCLYVWDGATWHPAGCPFPECIPEPEPDPSTMGTEFYAAFGYNGVYATASTYIFVDVGAKETTTVRFTYTYDGTYEEVTVPAGTTYRFEPTKGKVVAGSQSGFVQADSLKTLKITSDKPISAYAFNTGSATTDATYLLPTAVWGKSYFMVSHKTFAGRYAQQLIIAKENNTTVTPYDAKGVAQTPRTLNAGKMYIIVSAEEGDNTGCSVVADKPIGVFAHTTGSYIGSQQAADILFEQMMSVERWGKKFLVPSVKQGNLRYNYPAGYEAGGNRIRIFASQNGTTVTYSDGGDGSGVNATSHAYHISSGNYVDLDNDTPISSGGTLNAGQFVELRMDTLTGRYCTIEANKPVAVCAYLAGGQTGNACGDPAIAWIPALDQTITDALMLPFMFPATPLLSYTHLEGDGNFTTNPVHHKVTIITPTAGKASTTVNGTALSSITDWSTDTWVDDAATGYSFLTHIFDNTADLGKDFYFHNSSGLLILASGLVLSESYYYLATAGTWERGIFPAYHGPRCVSIGAALPAAPTGYTYTWSPNNTTGTGWRSVTVKDLATGKEETYTDAMEVVSGTCP
jgi:hypothetical protein